MIKLSKKADYAVLVMAHMAMRRLAYLEECGAASTESKITPPPPASAHEIASQAGLSRPLVANLLKTLTRASLLESVRGVAGGYRLARPAAEISLARILEAVEGPMRLVDCAAEQPQPGTDAVADSSVNCSLSDHCPSRGAMRFVHQRVARLMEEIYLPELLHHEQRGTLGQNPQPSKSAGPSKSPGDSILRS